VVSVQNLKVRLSYPIIETALFARALMWLENLRLLEKATPKSFSEFVKLSNDLDLLMLSSVLESLLWPDWLNSITLHF